jgi:ParB-like chromosome segregation protein Spo0J
VPRNLAEARQELEQLVLVESVAEQREERLRAFLKRLVDDFGFEPADLARRLGISERSVTSMVSGEDAQPVNERLNISEASVRSLLDDQA